MRRFSFRPPLEFRGRKFKGLRGFAGKPFHPPLTDVTVGAYFIGPTLTLLAYLFRESGWAADVYKGGGFVILLGAVSSLATVITGYADWLNTTKGTQVRRMANAHAWTMITMSVVVVAELWYRHLADSGAHYEEASAVSAALATAILLLVTIGGTIGGSLTYDWGFNVEVAKDHPVWHPSEIDVIHPHDPPPPGSQQSDPEAG